MNRLSRRDFIHAGCTLAAATLIANPLEARLRHGSIGGNNNRVTINAIGPVLPLINIAKTLSWGTIDPTIVDANGYLNNTTTSAAIQASAGWGGNWYGDWIWKWTGLGTMWLPAPLIVRETDISGTPTGGVIQGPAGTSGFISGAVVSGQTTPRVVFSFGVLVNGTGLE